MWKKVLNLNPSYSTALKYFPGVWLGQVSHPFGISSLKSFPSRYNQWENPPVLWVCLQHPKTFEWRVNIESTTLLSFRWLYLFFLAFLSWWFCVKKLVWTKLISRFTSQAFRAISSQIFTFLSNSLSSLHSSLLWFPPNSEWEYCCSPNMPFLFLSWR